jgi:hypothetical protein
MKPDNLPTDQQAVQITLDDRAWQPATYRRSEFVDVYGLPIDRQKIMSWRPLDNNSASNADT